MKTVKIGDILICHSRCIMDDKTITTTINKKYTITNINNFYLYIIDDFNDTHKFSLTKQNSSYYQRWFTNVKKQRKEKLKKLTKYD